ncbi:siderophore-interacting protein, partial [Tsukamurella tyrosinosolvens]
SGTVALNHAVAVGMAYGPEAGLALLARLDDDRALRDGHRLPAARAHLYELAGRPSDAAAAYRTAAARTASLPEQRYLNRRLRDLKR